MSDEWYVRIRGEVRGPMPESELQSQIRKKRIGRHHEISQDAMQWVRAGDVEGLFEPAIPVMQAVAAQPAAISPPSQPAHSPQTNPTTPAAQPIAEFPQPASLRTLAAADAPPPQMRSALPRETDWFYAQRGSRNGPVPESQLISLIASGQLLPTDLVWCEKFEQWTPLMHVTRLAAALPGQTPPQQVTTTRQSAAASQQVLPASLFAMVFACIGLLAAPLNAFIAALIAGNPAFTSNNIGAGILATLVIVAVFGAMPLFAAVAGIFVGHEALRFHRQNPTSFSGSGYALTALILCYSVVVITSIIVLVLLIVAGVKSA
jgi:hypothetical protein